MGRRGRVMGALALALAACQEPSAPEALSGAWDVESLAEALRGAGSVVEITGETVPSLFSVPGRILVVDGAQIEAFAFPDASSAEGEVHLFRDALILWLAPARLYRAEGVLVLQVGRERAIIDLLARVLGAPVATVGAG